MKAYALAYLSAAVCMLILDTIWLSTMALRFYRPLLGDLLLSDFRIGPAIAFYFLYVAGVLFLAVMPAMDAGRWTLAALNGLVLGLVAYGTYDLTNQATLRVWPTIITLVDLTWGSLLTAATATAGYCVVTLFRS